MRTDVSENMQPYVIIVEDDERLAELTAEYLRSNGIRVDVIGDGSVAIDAIIDNQPDMVVLDLMQNPKFAANDRVRKLLGTVTPVLQVSSMSTEGDFLKRSSESMAPRSRCLSGTP